MNIALSAEDRVALLLGRQVMRTQALEFRVEQLEAENAALKQDVDAQTADEPNTPAS